MPEHGIVNYGINSSYLSKHFKGGLGQGLSFTSC